MRIDRRCNLNIQCLGPNNLPAPILSIDRRNSIKEREWRNTYGEFILFRIDSRYISRYVIQNSSGEIVGGPLFYSSRSRFTAIRFFTGREIKRFSLPSSLLSRTLTLLRNSTRLFEPGLAIMPQAGCRCCPPPSPKLFPLLLLSLPPPP